MIQLIVDDGVPSRGHRKNIFLDAFRVMGSYTDSHSEFGKMTTVNYAGGFGDEKAQPPKPPKKVKIGDITPLEAPPIETSDKRKR